MTRVAAIQMCSSQSVEANLATAADLIAAAAKAGAKLIVLPEMFPFIGEGINPAREKLSEGRIQTFLSQQARQLCVWIIGGTIPIIKENSSKSYAACLVFNENGNLIAQYNKMHLFDVTLSHAESYAESEWIEAGQETVLLDTPFGKIGLAVCFDVRFPELFRKLRLQGAEIFVLPSAFTLPTGKAHWHVLTRSRAIENFCYLIAACQGGIHETGRKTYGHSLIINPWGDILAEKLDDGAGLITAEIDLKKLCQIRNSFPQLPANN